MKNFVTFLVLAVSALVSFAQSESEHLMFKGVPIDGTLSEYVSKMKSVGFNFLGEKDGTAVLKGEFAGFKDCKIFVSTLKAKDLVSTICVAFPYKNKWGLLEDDYKELKSMLTIKYGEPSEWVEEFQGYARTESQKYIKLISDECTWFSTFSAAKGDIQLSIKYTSSVGGMVVLNYFDEINTQSVRSHAINDL